MHNNPQQHFQPKIYSSPAFHYFVISIMLPKPANTLKSIIQHKQVTQLQQLLQLLHHADPSTSLAPIDKQAED